MEQVSLSDYLEFQVHYFARPKAQRWERFGQAFYKMVTKEGDSPINSTKIRYEMGETYEVKDADTDPNRDCGAGINVASMDWIIRNWEKGNRILVLEFTRADIACIPITSDGKFRLHRASVVAEKDPKEFGLDVQGTVDDWKPPADLPKDSAAVVAYNEAKGKKS